MKKVTTTAGAAVAAAPVPEAPRQTPDTAAEAGLTQTQPDPEPENSEPEQAPPFDPEAYRAFLASVPSEEFEQAFEVMMSEAHARGIIGTEADEERIDQVLAELEAEQEDELSEEDELKAVLKLHGLKQAWKDEAGTIYFDEKAAQAANAHLFTTAE